MLYHTSAFLPYLHPEQAVWAEELSPHLQGPVISGFCSCPHGPWWLTIQPEEEGGKGEGDGILLPLRDLT